MYKLSADYVTEVTPPSSEPITATVAKNHLRVDISDDDALIGNLITAAREYCEWYTGRSFIQRTYRADLPDFADDIQLPFGPVIAISSVKYYDTASPQVLQTWAASNYTLQNDMLRRNYGVSFPSVGTQYDNVQITYTAGFLDSSSPQAENVPESVKQAMLMLIGDMYENREAQVLYPGQLHENRAVRTLLHSQRKFR